MIIFFLNFNSVFNFSVITALTFQAFSFIMLYILVRPQSSFDLKFVFYLSHALGQQSNSIRLLTVIFFLIWTFFIFYFLFYFYLTWLFPEFSDTASTLI